MRSRSRRSRIERLYDEHAARLYGFLVYRAGDHGAAEDLLADVFERALRAEGQYRADRGRESTWLYAIALNLLRDRARRQSAERRALDRAEGQHAVTEQDTPPGAEDVIRRDELLRALDRLTAEERETVALRFGADLSVADIARVTGLALTTVEGRLYRGLRKLREMLDDENPR
jgi:RNA polymerase sigma-70 factor (ECF subfamily)